MKTLNRRDFLKAAGAASLTLAAASCKPVSKTVTPEEPLGPAEMPYRTDPKCGDRVSLLGYGCMRWPMLQDENGDEYVDQNAVDEMVDYAIAHGVNYFDSAPVYLQGQCESATAKALSRYPRESYYIATKLSNHRGFDRTYETGVQMYRNSLKIFNTDYIDYFLLHNCASVEVLQQRFLDNGLLDFLLKEREAGHIRHLGFSFHGNKKNLDELLALQDRYHWDFIQIQMNYVNWTHDSSHVSEMYDSITALGIPVVIMEPLLGGRLSSVPDAVAEKFKEREPAKSVASWAFRFCGSYPGVLTVLSGMTYMEHLQDNVSTFEHFKPLSEEEFSFLEEQAGLISDYPLVGCTGCQYCMPCPYGINIPGIFRHYNNAVNQGDIAQSAEQADFRKLKRAYLTTYDKAIESIRQADHCIGCGQCVDRCPQHIRIPQELRRIDRYVEHLKQETL